MGGHKRRPKRYRRQRISRSTWRSINHAIKQANDFVVSSLSLRRSLLRMKKFKQLLKNKSI